MNGLLINSRGLAISGRALVATDGVSPCCCVVGYPCRTLAPLAGCRTIRQDSPFPDLPPGCRIGPNSMLTVSTLKLRWAAETAGVPYHGVLQVELVGGPVVLNPRDQSTAQPGGDSGRRWSASPGKARFKITPQWPDLGPELFGDGCVEFLGLGSGGYNIHNGKWQVDFARWVPWQDSLGVKVPWRNASGLPFANLVAFHAEAVPVNSQVDICATTYSRSEVSSAGHTGVGVVMYGANGTVYDDLASPGSRYRSSVTATVSGLLSGGTCPTGEPETLIQPPETRPPGARGGCSSCGGEGAF